GRVGDEDDDVAILHAPLLHKPGDARGYVDHLISTGGVDGFVDDGDETHAMRSPENHRSVQGSGFRGHEKTATPFFPEPRTLTPEPSLAQPQNRRRCR